jgi:hypothetical protein
VRKAEATVRCKLYVKEHYGGEPLPAGGVAELTIDKQLVRKAEVEEQVDLFSKIYDFTVKEKRTFLLFTFNRRGPSRAARTPSTLSRKTGRCCAP